MEILSSPLTILGLLVELIGALAGLLMLLGVFPLSKIISAKHSLNRQAGKGTMLIFGAALCFNLLNIYSGDWNGWLTFLISVLFILVSFLGLRIFMSAMKELNKVAGHRNNRTAS